VDYKQQISTVHVDPRRPLVISDVDDVVLNFMRGYEMYIRDRGLYLETDDIGERRLRRQDSGASLEKAEVRELRRQFYRDKARHLEPIHGAADSLLSLAEVAGVFFSAICPSKQRNFGGTTSKAMD
jgi:hypothetical protein